MWNARFLYKRTEPRPKRPPVSHWRDDTCWCRCCGKLIVGQHNCVDTSVRVVDHLHGYIPEKFQRRHEWYQDIPEYPGCFLKYYPLKSGNGYTCFTFLSVLSNRRTPSILSVGRGAVSTHTHIYTVKLALVQEMVCRGGLLGSSPCC